MTVTTWSPAFEIDQLNRMFDSVFNRESSNDSTWAPAVDIYESQAHDVVIKLDLPEVKREAVKVTFENDVLTIEGERALDAEIPREQYRRLERHHGPFRRSFTLPATVDAGRAQAAFQDGVLTITLPQREEAKPRQIQVNG